MTQDSTITKNQDIAIQFTQRYLETIETNLCITFSGQGEPICIPDHISDSNIEKLRKELKDLMSGNFGIEAIKSSKEYGISHIQSIGFGHISDFDSFIKLGFLYGERVVLWDILSSRMLLSNASSKSIKGSLAEVACNLLLLRPIVNAGGLIVLPHPITWSKLAQKVEGELLRTSNKSSAVLGLSIALAAIEEGVPLHPYTLATSSKIITVAKGLESAKVATYSEENRIFNVATSALIGDSKFSYVAEMKASDFYHISAKYPDLHRSLRKHFSSLKGLSSMQMDAETKALVCDLHSAISKRDQAVSSYKIDGGLATIGFITSSLAVATSVLGATVLALTGLAPTAVSVIRRWIASPEKNVIVQFFTEAETARPFEIIFPTAIPQTSNRLTSDDPDLETHIHKLMDFS